MISGITTIIGGNIILRDSISKLVRSMGLGTTRTERRLPSSTALHRRVVRHLVVSRVVLRVKRGVKIGVSSRRLSRTVTGVTGRGGVALSRVHDHLTCSKLGCGACHGRVHGRVVVSRIHGGRIHHHVAVLPRRIRSLTRRINGRGSTDARLGLDRVLVPLPRGPASSRIGRTRDRTHTVISRTHGNTSFNGLTVTRSTSRRTLGNNRVN